MPLINRGKSSSKPKSRTVQPAKGKSGSSHSTRSAHKPAPTRYAKPSWWARVPAERKLDILGVLLSAVGALILLSLFTVNRSAAIGTITRVLAQIFGWGLYILPVALLIFGLWLVLRRIEKLPPLTLERGVGSILLFLWILTAIHAITTPLEFSLDAARAGFGGGHIGSFFHRTLWNLLGAGGGVTALLAWFIISMTMTFDISVRDLSGILRPNFFPFADFDHASRGTRVCHAKTRRCRGEWLYPVHPAQGATCLRQTDLARRAVCHHYAPR